MSSHASHRHHGNTPSMPSLVPLTARLGAWGRLPELGSCQPVPCQVSPMAQPPLPTSCSRGGCRRTGHMGGVFKQAPQAAVLGHQAALCDLQPAGLWPSPLTPRAAPARPRAQKGHFNRHPPAHEASSCAPAGAKADSWQPTPNRNPFPSSWGAVLTRWTSLGAPSTPSPHQPVATRLCPLASRYLSGSQPRGHDRPCCPAQPHPQPLSVAG